ncbi:hypothetical protein [Pyxidicoccus xibeiensis]|uniref:hypothetical protein n=1 Tax=Pyxidicoccus xibeiensis TaxID=2906759 RepID=UPI0020A7488F|nr:hypothetical protein [Pyxidicoccus xibeiensis]MCP3141859.1 hypothetical protein [Pyxidicoccus xibeiensis]
MPQASPRFTPRPLLTLLALLVVAWGGAAQAQVYTSGVADNFVAPSEPVTPSAGLAAWIAANYPNPNIRQNDDLGNDRYYATTFTNLLRNGRICGATLRTVIRSGDFLNNDSLNLWFNNGAFVATGWGSGLAALGIAPGQTGGVALNLAALPGGVNLIPTLNAQGFLDVVLQDDSAIDFVSLTITPCRTDVVIRDIPTDTGVEPGPYATNAVYNSPDIRVCQMPGCTSHQNAEFGQPNYVYVRMANTGPNNTSSPAVGVLHLYYTSSGGGAQWNSNLALGDWTLISSVPVTLVGATPQDIPILWNSVPVPGHYCLLARWESLSDPMTFVELANTLTNTRNNNNIAWKNFNVVNLSPLRMTEDLNFRVRNLLKDRESLADLEVRFPGQLPFLQYGQVTLRLPPELFARWSRKGTGFQVVGEGLVRITNPAGARLMGLGLAANGAPNVTIQFAGHAFDSPRRFEVELVQHSETEEAPGAVTEVGGVIYQVNLGAK